TASGNAYLTRKEFPGHECVMLTATHKTCGVTFRAGDMVAPLYDDAGALVNVQLINSYVLKRTLNFCSVPSPPPPLPSTPPPP
ncbi:hypothetical protein, partial [Escherichia coli]